MDTECLNLCVCVSAYYLLAAGFCIDWAICQPLPEEQFRDRELTKLQQNSDIYSFIAHGIEFVAYGKIIKGRKTLFLFLLLKHPYACKLQNRDAEVVAERLITSHFPLIFCFNHGHNIYLISLNASYMKTRRIFYYCLQKMIKWLILKVTIVLQNGMSDKVILFLKALIQSLFWHLDIKETTKI